MKKSLILGMTVLAMSTLTLVGCSNQQTSSSTASSSKASSVKEVSEKKETSLKKKSSEAESTSITASASSSTTKETNSNNFSSSSQASSSSTRLTQVKQQLIGQGFVIMPKLYDGENVDQAMAEDKAPQNTVHDGYSYLVFSNDTTLQRTKNGYIKVENLPYTVTEQTINISNYYKIPYSLTNGTLSFKPVNNQVQGHTYTFEFKPDSSAQQMLDNTHPHNY